MFNECKKMGMGPVQDESTGSLLTALRHVRYSKAFYAIEARFTVHDGPDPQCTWLVKLDKIKGIVTARSHAWKTGKWIVLCMSQKAHDKQKGNNKTTPGRFIWADGSVQMLVSSSGDCFGVEVSGDDGGGAELVLVPRVCDKNVRRIDYIGGL